MWGQSWKLALLHGIHKVKQCCMPDYFYPHSSLTLCVSMFCAAVLRVYLDSAKKKQRQREEKRRQRKIWKKVAETRKHAATMNVK